MLCHCAKLATAPAHPRQDGVTASDPMPMMPAWLDGQPLRQTLAAGRTAAQKRRRSLSVTACSGAASASWPGWRRVSQLTLTSPAAARGKP